MNVIDGKSRREVGSYLAYHRKKIYMTQTKLSIKLNFETPQIVSNWERGLALPPYSRWNSLCELLEIEKKDFAGFIVQQTKNSLYRYFSI